MVKKITFLPFCMILFFFVSAQPSRFNKITYYDEFNDSSYLNWKIVNNADNLYLMEEGRYQLNRKNKVTADLVFCNWQNTYNNFEMEMLFCFESSKNKKQYAGFVFKAGTSEALLAEVSEMGMARLRKIEDGKSLYLTGTKEGEGWIKFQGLVTGYNKLSLQSDFDMYYVLLNGIAIASQRVTSYPGSRIGVLIGANSNVKIDYIKLLTEEIMAGSASPDNENPATSIGVADTARVTSKAENTNSKTKPENTATKNSKGTVGNNKHRYTHEDSVRAGLMTSAEVKELQKKVYDLQQQLNTFRNRMYKELDRADSLQAILDNDGKKNYREDNKRLTRENNAITKLNDSLYLLLQTYNDVRTALNKLDGGELSVKLSEKLYQEKSLKDILDKRNKELEMQNKKLSQQIQSMQEEIEALKKKSKDKKK